MDRRKIERAIIGFLVGGVMGAVMGLLVMWLFNLALGWIGREAVEISWSSVLPFALIVGLSMAINTANPPFTD